jgi:hypothetical protein
MKYGNLKHGAKTEQKITQIIISGKESEFGLVEEMINKHHLESKSSQLDIGRLKSIVGTLILVVVGISVIALFVSGLVLIQYAQLLMSRNAYEVKTLLRIGYAPNTLIKAFFVYFLKVFGWVCVVGFGVFVGIKFWMDAVLAEGGLYIDNGMTLTSILAVVGAYVAFGVASYINAKKGIYKQF